MEGIDDRGEKLFLFIDSDHVFNGEDIIKLEQEDGDVCCGIYCSSANSPNAFPINPTNFATDRRLYYGGTGFMLIRHRICKKLKEQVLLFDKELYVNVDRDNENVIPFFKTRIIQSELNRVQIEKDWLGEDYSFCWLVRQAGGVIKGVPLEGMGHQVATIRYFRDHPSYQKSVETRSEVQRKKKVHIPNDKKTRNIVYYCGNSRVRFSPENTNLGGSEKAVINICKQFAKLNHKVTVFGNVRDGVYENVKYKKVEKFNAGDIFDVLILWRGFGLSALKHIETNSCRVLVVDLHDSTDMSRFNKEDLNKVDKFMVKSEFHKSIFDFPSEKVEICKNGLEEVYGAPGTEEEEGRSKYRFCYTSCYTRNLVNVLKNVWPQIVAEYPESELHLYYGMDLVDVGRRRIIENVINNSKGVYDHGRQSLKELRNERLKSTYNLYIYVGDLEIDCLSVRESCVTGCIPIISNEKLFMEREGFHVSGSFSDPDYYENASSQILELMRDEERVSELREKCKSTKETYWEDVSKTWLSKIATAGRRPMVGGEWCP
jgi:hypothetical protein